MRSSTSAPRQSAAVASGARLLAEPAGIDWLMLAYLAVELFSVFRGRPGPTRDHFLGYLGALFVGYLGVIVAYRAFAPTGPIVDRLYRLAPMVTTCAVYFRLKHLFPIVNPNEYDALLTSADRALFGTDLSVWVEPLASRGVIDWFSAWYWLYFPMCLCGILWCILVSREPERRTRFAVGTILCFLIGHTIYTIVPGMGPWHHLAEQYAAPLEGGWFFQANWRTYRTGAGHDIFPSLHTAVSVYFAIFLWRERRDFRPARWLAWPVTLIAINIVLATIVLRWHYFVDLVAGTGLAVLCDWISRGPLARYEILRARLGVSPRYW